MDINFLKKLRKLKKNDAKILPKALKYLGKLKTVADYDDYKKSIYVSLIDFGIEYILIKPFVIFFCISCLSANLGILSTPNNLVLAEGISFLWFLLIEFKRELWRNENG